MKPSPTNPVCEDFITKIGGKQKFSQLIGNGAKIHKNGKVYDCYPEEGIGEFGWCKVGGLILLALPFSSSKIKSNKTNSRNDLWGFCSYHCKIYGGQHGTKLMEANPQ